LIKNLELLAKLLNREDFFVFDHRDSIVVENRVSIRINNHCRLKNLNSFKSLIAFDRIADWIPDNLVIACNAFNDRAKCIASPSRVYLVIRVLDKKLVVITWNNFYVEIEPRMRLEWTLNRTTRIGNIDRDDAYLLANCTGRRSH